MNMTKSQESYFIAGLIVNLRLDRERYKNWARKISKEIKILEKLDCNYPGLDDVINTAEDSIALYLGRVHFYNKAIDYFNFLIEERNLKNILDRMKGTKKPGGLK